MSVMSSISKFTKTYPIVRGMATYAVLWPTSNICQQLIQKRKQLDFKEAARFSLFGVFYVAPTLFTWIKVASIIIPGRSFKDAVMKAVLEQFMYSPVAITGFYGGMTLLEGKSLDDAILEVDSKYWQTFKMGVCVWPIVQTINFAFVKERNRVPVTSVVSFFWTVFLSYMKQLDRDRHKKTKNIVLQK